MSDAESHAAKPLEGIRVLDLSRVLAGPFCTMILADLGAEVVKIERPGVGDDSRHFGPFLPSGLSGYFASINRGKKSIELDFKEEKDRRLFMRLAERADVLVENFRPGTMDALGLGEDRLRQANPRLIYAAASGFGRDGLHGNRPAYDAIVQAMSGLMSVTGADPRHPVRVGTSISDILTGMFTAIGILSALRLRDCDGQGTGLDMAMLDCTVAALENAVSRTEITGQPPQPLGTRHPSITPFQAFETADRPIVVAAGNDSLWRRLCETVGHPQWADDPLFRTNNDRTENHAALEALFNEVFQKRPSAEWQRLIEEAGIPCAPIRNMKEVTEDEHLQARGMFHVLEDGAGNSFKTVSSPLRFGSVPLAVSHHVPALGEHTEEVLRDWLSEP